MELGVGDSIIYSDKEPKTLQQEIAREFPTGDAELKVSRVSFSAFPRQSRLFLEYQRDPHSLKKFYPNALSSLSDLAPYSEHVLPDYTTDRNSLCNALTDFNTSIEAGQRTADNINLLRTDNAVAVVTGQQAGLFTGPLYTVYKALTAIKLAGQLRSMGINAVPVFWIATEDHDLDEVSRTSFIGKGGELFQPQYQPRDNDRDVPVGNVVIGGSMSVLIEELFENLPASEYSEDLRILLTSCWAKDSKFGFAFAKTLAAILRDHGLIFIDPMDERIKELAAPIYADAVRKADEITERVGKRSRELESEGFHSQVLVEDDYFPLFWQDDQGRRKALRKSSDGRYRPKGDRGREFTRTELERMAVSDPERFSPGVMLRPVVQDYLLPTVCYLGGAAEIAYFAQNSEVYSALGRLVTPILHRQSFTIMGSGSRKVLDKYDLTITDLFDGLEATLIKLAETKISAKSAQMFAEVEEVINSQLHRLDQRLSQVDPTLAANLATRRRKIIYHIAALRKKTLLAELRQHETANRQIADLFTSLLPIGELQERSINVFTYLNNFGPRFIDWIYQSIDLEDKDHRIIDL